jgi:hypothetical protein
MDQLPDKVDAIFTIPLILGIVFFALILWLIIWAVYRYGKRQYKEELAGVLPPLSDERITAWAESLARKGEIKSICSALIVGAKAVRDGVIVQDPEEGVYYETEKYSSIGL